jgi:dihydrodipicolinate synthase/N-acetylneuraminate lyase
MTDDSYRLTDDERVALVEAAVKTLTGNTTMAKLILLSAVAKIGGTDTVVFARRAYPPQEKAGTTNDAG